MKKILPLALCLLAAQGCAPAKNSSSAANGAQAAQSFESKKQLRRRTKTIVTPEGDEITIINDSDEATGDTSCQPQAFEKLKANDPHGYALLTKAHDMFVDPAWWACTDFVGDLDTAVHETTHMVSIRHYVLADGSTLPRPENPRKFFPPYEISDVIDPSLDHSFYILNKHDPEQPSSVTQFASLLDEMNAYSVGLSTTTKLNAFKTETDDARDGAAAFLFYLDQYAKRAKEKHPSTFAALNEEPVRSTVQKLWAQAEATEAEACRQNVSGFQDGWYWKKLCEPTGHDAIAQILGSKPECKTLCLKQAIKRDADNAAGGAGTNSDGFRAK